MFTFHYVGACEVISSHAFWQHHIERKAESSKTCFCNGEGVRHHLAKGKGGKVLLVGFVIAEDKVVIVIDVVDATTGATHLENAGIRSCLLDKVYTGLTCIVGEHYVVPITKIG